MRCHLHFAVYPAKLPALAVSKHVTNIGTRLYQENFAWIGGRSLGTDKDRPIVFSAAEQYYPEELLKDPNRIRVNSFNAASEMAKRKMGRVLVALPTQRSPHPVLDRGKQWIYLVLPNYQKVPESLKRVIAVVREEARKY
jgi:hypothetical protein